MAIRANQVLIKAFTATSSATPNQQTVVAHGLPTTPNNAHVEIWPIAAADDVSSVPSVAFVSVGATNVTFKCNMPSIACIVKIWRNKDDFGRPLNEV